MGIVGLPNVGKSSLYNLLTKQQVRAENFPFCTRDPNFARVVVPDPRFDYLCQLYEPQRQVPPSLEIVDIAGLVRGASEGAGLGNEFLSHIQAVDGIYHVVRVFDNEEITHVEGNIDAIRDMEIIHNELRLKDIDVLEKQMEPMRRNAKADPTKRIDLDVYEKTLEYMKSGKDVRDGVWSTKEYELINELFLLCSKPIIYIVNMAQEDFERQKNRWLPRMKNWIQEHAPGAQMIPMSVAFEQYVSTLSDQDRDNYLTEKKTRVMIPKIITTGFNSLHLINFFTVGTDEVKAWVLREGMTAPKAAGCIHTDFEKKFVRAEVMKYEELKEIGSEQEVKARGKYYTEGKNYIVQDGDILLIKHAAGGGGKKK
jgi:obg-like ATPase 1